ENRPLQLETMGIMRELVLSVALVFAHHTGVLPKPPESNLEYKCQEDQDANATLAAERFINEHHHHGYKFRFVAQDSRSVKEATVTSKCNVTIVSVQGKAMVRSFICDTEPASDEALLKKCPDCPSLLPLHEPKALESVKVALDKFNKGSNHKSYFKLMEMGRISTQGQSYFAQFAIIETKCPNKETPQSPEACKALCGDQARYGFCKSTKVGSEEPEVNCEIYHDQNFTHLMKHPAQSRRDCHINLDMFTHSGQIAQAMITKKEIIAFPNIPSIRTKTKNMNPGDIQNTLDMTTRTKSIITEVIPKAQHMMQRKKTQTGGDILSMNTGAVTLQGSQRHHLRGAMSFPATVL
ncbi:hypothetical protein DNTS_009214, partial [Danionella cerebrum]